MKQKQRPTRRRILQIKWAGERNDRVGNENKFK